MPEYLRIDPEFERRFWDILGTLNRGHPSGGGIYKGKCQKQIFVKRVLDKWLSGKYIAMVMDEKLNVFFGDTVHKMPRKSYVSIQSVEYVLGHGEEIRLYVSKAGSTITVCDSLVFSSGQLNLPEFYEITKDKFDEVRHMFDDDRPTKTYRFYVRFEKNFEEKVIIEQEAKDEREAYKILRERDDLMSVIGEVESNSKDDLKYRISHAECFDIKGIGDQSASDILPEELARSLKDVGFNVRTYHYFIFNCNLPYVREGFHLGDKLLDHNSFDKFVCSAPTKKEAMEWIEAQC